MKLWELIFGRSSKTAEKKTKRPSKKTALNVEQDQMPYNWCPLCRSHNVLYGSEEGDGECVCMDCGFTWNEYDGMK